jgi:DNA phosphorothioation-dependent restriction protein DptG
MKFTLDKVTLQKMMFNKDKIAHHTGNSIRLFPFVANATSIGEVKDDLKDFMGIAGSCFRECLGYSHDDQFDKKKFINNICSTAEAPGNKHLEDLIQKVAFNERGQLVLFDTQVYPHLRNSVDNKTLKDIGKFIVSVFFDDEDKAKLTQLAEKAPDNLFYKLILSCMPKPEEATPSLEPYYIAASELKLQFKADLNTLISDTPLFVSHFHELVKFYFFKYVTDLAIRLNVFFGDLPEPLYFSLRGEKLQSSRAALNYGWNLFEGPLMGLFSHVVTLELVNYIKGFNPDRVTYQDIKKQVEGLTLDEIAELAACISELIELYRNGVQDVQWEKFQPKPLAFPNQVFSLIHQLFEMVEFQFSESSRGRAREAYQKWLLDFAVKNFTKPRGPLGNSFALDQEYVLLLTRLSVAESEKIRLKELWRGFQDRGIAFDSFSRDHIIQYFEKINLLEKKSDSGDAQYVKKFSQTFV